MKEEDNILRKVGTENAFRVPEGYFERLVPQVMEHLPEREKPLFAPHAPTRWERLKPWGYMAAMFVGAALIIRVASSLRGDATQPAEALALDEAESEMQYINMAMENTMMDDYSLYVYLADAEE
ncbi:MAG: ribosome biogenesis regulatory protein homolog [Prevotellaceae bacterium]|nr:ribosome biogenesis regulatory protein homolog [Prevotellaceae bacterium]